MKYGNHSVWKKFISSPVTFIVLIILFVFLSKAAWGIREKALLSAEKLRIAQNELIKLESRQKDLSNQIGYLSTDEGVEAELRTKYRAVKEGESVAVIIDTNPTNIVSATSTSVNTKGWWQKLLQMLGF